MTYYIETENDSKEFDDEDAWHDMIDLLNEQGVKFSAKSDETNGTETFNPTPDGGQAEAEPVEPADLPQPSELTSDPLEVIRANSDHFTDQIKGKTVINRQGYAVLAERFNISVIANPVTLPSETDQTYAEFRATAETRDGVTYSGFGSAHVDRDDDPTLLAELAETRAMKRSCAWATGVGMTAVSELTNTLEESA